MNPHSVFVLKVPLVMSLPLSDDIFHPIRELFAFQCWVLLNFRKVRPLFQGLCYEEHCRVDIACNRTTNLLQVGDYFGRMEERLRLCVWGGGGLVSRVQLGLAGISGIVN